MNEKKTRKEENEPTMHRNSSIPQDSKILEWHGFLGFPTRIRYKLSESKEVEWISRRERKRKRQAREGQTKHWWESVRITQWMCALFMIGSFAFAAGALMSFIPSLPGLVVGGTYFVGSLFFTTAAYLQFFETINTPPVPLDETAGGTDHPVFIAWQTHRIDWWSTATQLIGTFYFNITTFYAMSTNLSPLKSFVVVWSADFFGSILFLISSWLAYGETTSALTGSRWHSLAWRIVLLNLLGSVAFGVSAITSFVRPTVGEMISATATNLFTFLGALGFFFGAMLQLQEIDRENARVNGDNPDTTSAPPQNVSNLADGQK